MSRKKIAIVGSRCLGMGTLWPLKGSSHKVHLIASASQLGGEINTVTFEGSDGESTYVDIWLIVFNTATHRQSTKPVHPFLQSSWTRLQQTLPRFWNTLMYELWRRKWHLEYQGMPVILDGQGHPCQAFLRKRGTSSSLGCGSWFSTSTDSINSPLTSWGRSTRIRIQ